MIIPVACVHSREVVTRTIREDAPAAADEPSLPTPAPSFREVFDKHARYVWRSLLGLGVQERDVADASQQVFLVVHDRLSANQIPAAALRTFVYGVCLRVASDHRRRAHRRHERLVATPPEPSQPANQEQTIWQREVLAHLDAVLEGLPPSQREAFVLYEIEEMSMNEIASALGCPLQTAYSRLHAARRVVVAALNEAFGELPGPGRGEGDAP